MIPRPNLLSGEDLPPGPQQKRSQAKRERLMKTGLALFGEQGYERTSVGAIARRAKLPLGTFYQHFRSKRQLLLVLMDELLEKLSHLKLQPAAGDARAGLRAMLAAAFAQDLRYLGAYRAWQEAVLSDAELAQKGQEIHAWTGARATALFEFLQGQPGARAQLDLPGLARAMDTFFWSLLGQATHMPRPELERWLDAATHLIYHGLFED